MMRIIILVINFIKMKVTFFCREKEDKITLMSSIKTNVNISDLFGKSLFITQHGLF